MKKIENWLLIAACLLLVSSFLLTQTVDIHLHDTYYIIAGFSIARLTAFWTLLVFLLYKIIRRRRNTVSTKAIVLHSATTFIPVIFILFYWSGNGAQRPRYLDYSSWHTPGPGFQSLLLPVLMLLCIVSQVIFLLYFVVQVIKSPRFSS
jgi:heme/copper-type cytochrome/quinol oxidase subunit 1